MARPSIFERLREMPDVFSLTSFCRLAEMDIPSARVTISRWTAKGMVKGVGPRAAVYYNLANNRTVTEGMMWEALLKTFPSAVLAGETVLHRAGWTTQIPQAISVAVQRRSHYTQVDGFKVYGRGRRWFDVVRPHLSERIARDLGVEGVPSLPPAFALADAFGDPEAWHPDPDDLDLDDDALPEIVEAFRTLSLPVPDRLVEVLEVGGQSPRP